MCSPLLLRRPQPERQASPQAPNRSEFSRQDHQAQRHHPESEDREKKQHPAGEQGDAKPNAGGAGARQPNPEPPYAEMRPSGLRIGSTG